MARSVVARARASGGKRNLKKVPFVELYDGKLQGVVSSGSDIKRVYVSWLAAQSGDYGCSTNNNRPCGGLRGGPCKHIQALYDNAVAEFGQDEVTRYLGQTEAASPARMAALNGGTNRREGSGPVFARFLDYLGYVELPPHLVAHPEMAWFVG